MADLKDNIKASGTLLIQLFDKDGNLKLEREEKNLVVTTGLSFIASRMKDATATVMSHMAIGSSSTAAALGNTTLGTELGRSALTSTTVTTNATQYIASFGPGVGTGNVVEAGIFNAASAGTMLNRSVFGIITKDATDSLQITWTVTIS